MKQLIFILLIGLVPGSLLPQQRVDLFGYFESQFMGARIGGRFIQMQSNKLRMDLESSVSDKVAFGANVNAITFHGKTRWEILEYLPDRVTADIPAELRPLYVLPFDDRIVLDNAWVRLSFKHADVTLGKQQISPGVGYAWNPTDIFNTKDLLDPTYEQPGHNAVRADIPLSGRWTVTSLYSPEETWTHSTKLLQVKGGLSRFDIHISAAETMWRFHDYTAFNADLMNPGFVEQPEKRRMLGLSTAGELLGLGVWTEYARNWMDRSADFTEWVIGADYTFDSGTYVMSEFYRNTLGKTKADNYTLNDWMRFLSQEQKAVARDQIYVLVQHPATDLLSVGLSTICTVTDGSAALLPTLNWTPFENVEILAYINLYAGKAEAAFNSRMGNGGLVRARIYF